MRKGILITLVLLLTSHISSSAQFIVHDIMGEITAIMNSLEEVAVSTDNLNATLDNVDRNSRMLDIAVDNIRKLRTVSKKVKHGAKVVEVLAITVETGNLYTKLAKVLVDGNFSQLKKAKHLANLYSMFCKSTQYAIELEEMITDNTYEMTDAERLRFINELHNKVVRNHSNMSYYGKRLMEDDYYNNSLDNDIRILKQIL